MVVETESPVDNGIQGKSDRAESDTNVEFVESDDSCADVHDVNLETVEEAKPDQAQAQSDQTEAQSESNVEIVESCERPEVVGVTEYLDDGSVITHDKELVTECIQLPPKAMEFHIVSQLEACDDKKLLEENERLRVAVEELMKAGNQQLDVIKELTGRVKDLEKKLSKKKKVKLNKGRCRGSVVKDELRSCLV
ncbi:BAG family molecular chaperone regulator 6 [Tanacetum coccineum]